VICLFLGSQKRTDKAPKDFVVSFRGASGISLKKERKEFSFLSFFNGKTTAQMNKGGKPAYFVVG